MQSNSTLKKLSQISEEALPPIHVPLTLDNECYVITQQDFRKIEDIRLLSLSKLMRNGDLQPLNCSALENLIQMLKLRIFLDSQSQNRQNLIDLLNVRINDCSVGQQSWPLSCPKPCSQQPQYQCQVYPQPMETSSCPSHNSSQVASVQQQLTWNTFTNTSAPFPMTYSQGTSSTEIEAACLNGKTQKNIQTCCSCCCCLSCRSKSNAKTVTFSKGTYTQDLLNDCEKSMENLGAREQLKRKKLSYDFSCLT